MTRGALIAILLSFVGTPVWADDLSTLVDKYVAWRGGAAFERLQSTHAVADVEVGGLKGVAEAWDARDGRTRAQIDLGVVKETQIVASGGGWQITASGQTQPMPATAADLARRALAIEFGEALRGRAGAKAELLGTETRDGKSWSVVRVRFGDDDAYDAFLDPATGALLGWRIMENRKGRFETSADWRMVDGVRLNFTETVTSDLPGGDSSVHVRSFELNRPLDPALFAAPAAVHKAAFKGGATSTAWIPFEFFDRNRIFFPAKVNGHPVTVLLDSGAETSVLDKAYAASIGLTSQGAVSAVGTGGGDTAGLIGGVTVEIGDLTLSDLTVASLDIESIGKRIGHPLPVVLGNEVFNELAVDIDFEGRRIAFRDPSALTRPAGAAEVPLTSVLGIRSIPVSVEGRAPAPFDFDLGNGAPLLVFPAYYQPQKLLGERPQSQAYAGAIGGFHAETIATLHTVTVAGVDFVQVPTTFTADTQSAVNSNKTFGNVGLPILSRFHLVIDYPHDRLFATPYADAAATAFVRDRLGLLVQLENGGFTVKFVAPGGPADIAGFKAGERITRINRKPPEAWPKEQLRALSGGAPGTEVEFSLDGGAVRRLKLADYY